MCLHVCLHGPGRVKVWRRVYPPLSSRGDRGAVLPTVGVATVEPISGGHILRWRLWAYSTPGTRSAPTKSQPAFLSGDGGGMLGSSSLRASPIVVEVLRSRRPRRSRHMSEHCADRPDKHATMLCQMQVSASLAPRFSVGREVFIIVGGHRMYSALGLPFLCIVVSYQTWNFVAVVLLSYWAAEDWGCRVRAQR